MHRPFKRKEIENQTNTSTMIYRREYSDRINLYNIMTLGSYMQLMREKSLIITVNSKAPWWWRACS